jgi:hypothetical protein
MAGRTPAFFTYWSAADHYCPLDLHDHFGYTGTLSESVTLE